MRHAVVLLSLSAACTANLGVPPGAQIECAADADCPAGLTCDTTASLCVEPGATAPTVVLQSVGEGLRPFSDVAIGVVVTDSSDTELTLALELATDCAASDRMSSWAPATFSVADEDDGHYDLVWHARDDAGDGLVAASVDTDGDDEPDLDGVADCARARVRVSASNAVGLTSPWVESEDFALGNAAPSVDDLALLDARASGNTVLRVVARDDAGDVADVAALELSLTGDFTDTIDLLATGAFPVGGLEDFVAAPDGAVAHDFVWDSRLPVPVDAAAAVLRVRVRDALGAVSASHDSPPFVIDNTNALPVLLLAQVLPPDVEANGTVDDVDVALCYTVSDGDADQVSVATEVAIDAGPFVPAFVSEMAAPDSGWSCERWNRVQAGVGVAQVRLRLTPSDGSGDGEGAELGPFTLDTRPKAAPSILDLELHLPSSGLDAPAAIPMSYRLVDSAGDVASIDPEYSLDDGSTWVACREYPAPESEGLVALGATPLGATPDIGGVRHVFLWDATGLAWQAQPTLLRVRARDGRDPGESTVTVSVPGTIGVALDFTVSPYAAGTRPIYVQTADLDGDGVLDLAVANLDDDDVSVFLGGGSGGLGDGSFATAVDYPVGDGPFVVQLALVDGDGVLDLVVANLFGGSVSILLGQGDGTFAENVEYTVGGSPTAIATGFFDGDGALDLAVTNESSGNLSVLLGLGDGTFGTPAEYTLGPQQYGAVAGDFDSDAVVDLVVASYYNRSAHFLHGNGDGTFSEGARHISEWPSSIAGGDFNGDGALDIAVTNGQSDSVSIGLGAGDGTFGDGGDYATGDAPMDIVTADLNGDRVLDLVFPVVMDGAASVLFGQGQAGRGDGTFGPRLLVPAPASEPSSVAVGDFDADGTPDLVLANDWRPGITVLLADPPGPGSGAFANRYSFAATTPFGLAAADYDADGITDLAVASLDHIELFLGEGSGGLGTGSFAAARHLPGSAYAITSADFDGDRIPDLAAASSLGTLSILLGNGSNGAGDGTFGEPLELGVGPRPMALTTSDFDGDGDADVAVANYMSDTVTTLLGNGDGSFADAVDLATGRGPAAVIAADFDGDGAVDLAAANMNEEDSSPLTDDTVSVFFGAGDGTFDAGIETGVGDTPSSLAAADFDGDGVMDLAVANRFVGQISILIGQGRSFAPRTSVNGPRTPIFLTAGDFNADAITDLAVADVEGSAVWVLLGSGAGGRGDGAFSVTGPYEVGVWPYALASGDFNGDGVSDLAVPCEGANNVAILLGRSGDTRALSQPIAMSGAVSTGPTAIARFTWVEESASFPIGARVEPRAAPAEALPLTAAWRVDGDLRLRRIEDPGSPGFGHLRPENRLGEPTGSGLDREGLTMAASGPCNADRALLVNLPILGAASVGGTIRVELTTTDWLRADAMACTGAAPGPELAPCVTTDVVPRCDPYGSDPRAAEVLPRVPRCIAGRLAYDDVVVRRTLTVDVPRDPDGNLATGCGRRFAIDQSDPHRRVVQVLTDRLGVVQAFVQ